MGYQKKYEVENPLETLEYGASFSSDQCAEGVVAVSGDALRIFTIERMGETFNTPKIHSKEVCASTSGEIVVIIESIYSRGA